MHKILKNPSVHYESVCTVCTCFNTLSFSLSASFTRSFYHQSACLSICKSVFVRFCALFFTLCRILHVCGFVSTCGGHCCSGIRMGGGVGDSDPSRTAISDSFHPPVRFFLSYDSYQKGRVKANTCFL